MKRCRYLFAVVDGGGNVPPELGAARRLVERGHAVTVLAEDSIASDVLATGATLRRWSLAPNRSDRTPEHDPVRDWECKYPWQLVDRLVTTLLVGPAAAYAQDVLDAVRDARPDLIACSMFSLGAMVAADAIGIPFDVLLPNIYPFPAPGLPPFGLGLQPAHGMAGQLRDRILNGVAERLWNAKGLAGLNALRRRFGLPPLERLFDQVAHARRQLVLTSASFDFPARLPANARYVGPVLDEPAWAESSRWAAPLGEAPLVLVALSSTFQDQIACLQRIVHALSTIPVRAVVTTGPAVDPTALSSTSNIAIVQRAPHREVLWQAALAITHGGHGTVMKALAAGVPILVLPHGRDQADTAARVTARGAGIALARTARSDAIGRAVRHVLQHDSYRRAARRLGEVIRRDADGNTLVDELEALSETDLAVRIERGQIDRRQFLFASGSAALVGLAPGASPRVETGLSVEPFRVTLPIPPVLSPVRSDATADYYEIVQREAVAEIIPGVRTRVWAYNGIVPGPTIEARRGRTVVVRHTNRLDRPTVVHLHGGITRPESDGFPSDVLPPGETRVLRYDNTGHPATLWYHDHSWRGAGRNLYMGLAGLYLLKGDSDLDQQLPSGRYDIPLMLQDRSFTSDGELAYEHDRHHGAVGRVMLVNGAPWPVLEVAARKYRFRIVNASNAMPVRLALGTKQPLVQIATDHGLLPSAVTLTTLALSMGERTEVVIDFSVYPIGTGIVLENDRGEGGLRRIMRFDVVRAERDDSRVPERLADVESLSPLQATRTRTFVFGGQPTIGVPPGVRWVINNDAFDPNRVDAAPRLGDVEVWRFLNRRFFGRTMLHPVHTHLAPFQILRRNGGPPLRHEGGWKDTVAIEDGEEVDVIIRWSGYTGRYLLHCHNLEHEDHSMMARVDVG
jgi:MGT family glycosyltransferase